MARISYYGHTVVIKHIIEVCFTCFELPHFFIHYHIQFYSGDHPLFNRNIWKGQGNACELEITTYEDKGSEILEWFECYLDGKQPGTYANNAGDAYIDIISNSFQDPERSEVCVENDGLGQKLSLQISIKSKNLTTQTTGADKSAYVPSLTYCLPTDMETLRTFRDELAREWRSLINWMQHLEADFEANRDKYTRRKKI